MTLASLLQRDSHDLDSGEGGEMLDTARSLFDFLGFLGWICQGFSLPLESRRVPLYSMERDGKKTGSDLHFTMCKTAWRMLNYTHLRSSQPTMQQIPTGSSESCRDSPAWFADGQWGKEWGGLVSQLSAWSSSPIRAKQRVFRVQTYKMWANARELVLK